MALVQPEEFYVTSVSRKFRSFQEILLRFQWHQGTVSFLKFRRHKVNTYPCSSFSKFQKSLKEPTILTVTIGHGNAKEKTLTFRSGTERDRFCNLIRAVIVCGPQAYATFTKLDTDHSGTVSRVEFQTAVEELRAPDDDEDGEKQRPSIYDSLPLEMCYSDFLLKYSEAVTLERQKSSRQRPSQAATDFSDLMRRQKGGDVEQKDLQLLDGERVLTVQNYSSLTEGPNTSRGTLVLTNYRLHYDAYESEYTTDVAIMSVQRFDHASPTTILLTCKSLRAVCLGFDASPEWVAEFLRQLRRMAFPAPVRYVRASDGQGSMVKQECEPQKNTFAFHHHIPTTSIEEDGWNIYDPAKEYSRLGLLDSSLFTMCHLNLVYEISPTYPRLFVLPKGLSDEELEAVCNYRSKQRIPVVVWIHPRTGATLCRCAQPMAGFKKRCVEDEKLFALIREVNKEHPDQLYIVDARPFKAAVGNSLMGKGYENTANYPNTELLFMGIDNIHAIRGSYEKLMNLCQDSSYLPDDPSSNFAQALESTQWLYYIRLILRSAVRMARRLSVDGHSVVTHCSDGWDRTPQLTGLTQLLLDPYYRTLEGLCVLIEKEWLSFGHMYARRFGHADGNSSDEQRSPVFIQFIDCVWQLTQQFPLSFQFNERFLLEVLEHVYSCRFGTFLFNSEEERSRNSVRFHTASLWTYLSSPEMLPLVVNPHYTPNQSELKPNCTPKRVMLWERYYLQWDRGMSREQQWSDEASCRMAVRYKQAILTAVEAGVDQSLFPKEDLIRFGLESRSVDEFVRDPYEPASSERSSSSSKPPPPSTTPPLRPSLSAQSSSSDSCPLPHTTTPSTSFPSQPSPIPLSKPLPIRPKMKSMNMARRRSSAKASSALQALMDMDKR